jgi:Na+/H+-dicarboxylate symporter
MNTESTWLARLSGPLGLGVAVGLSIAVGLSAPGFAKSLAVVGDAYLALLKMVLLPFLVSAMLCNLARVFRTPDATQYIRGLLSVYPAGLLLAAAIGVGWALALQPGVLSNSAAGNVLGQIVDSTHERFSTDVEITLVPKERVAAAEASRLGALIPSNIFAALGTGDTLPVLVFCVLFGLAMGRALSGRGELLGMLEGVYRTCQTFVGWLGYLLPLGLFALLASHIAHSGLAPLLAMGDFVLAQSLGALTLAAVAVALVCWRTRLAPWEALRSLWQPIVLAVATRSSIACIPSSIEALVKGLQASRAGAELLLPLGVTIFRFGSALYFALAAVFIAQLYGRPLAPAELLMIVGAASLAAVASSGTTGVLSLSLVSMVCVPLRLPYEAALVLFIAVDALMDPLRTLCIVLGNCSACCWVAGGHNHPAEDVPALGANAQVKASGG